MTTIVYVTFGWFLCGLVSHLTLKLAKKYTTQTLNQTLTYAIGPALVIVLVFVTIFQLGRIVRLAATIQWDFRRIRRRQNVFLRDVRVQTFASCVGCKKPVGVVHAIVNEPRVVACSPSCVSVALERLHKEEKEKREARMDAWWAKT